MSPLAREVIFSPSEPFRYHTTQSLQDRAGLAKLTLNKLSSSSSLAAGLWRSVICFLDGFSTYAEIHIVVARLLQSVEATAGMKDRKGWEIVADKK